MGTIISMGVHAEAQQAARVYAASLRRLSGNASLRKATLEGWVPKKEVKRMPKVALTAGDLVFMEEEISLNDAGFQKVIENIPFSKKTLKTTLLYPLLSGSEVGLSVFLYGKESESGLPRKENGYVRACVSMNDVDRPIRSLSYGPADFTTTKAELYANSAFRQLAGKVTEDWDELFIRICGVGDQGFPVSHAAMYLENGWPSPACCAMVYHRDKMEYTRDFSRMYQLYHSGEASMPALLSGEQAAEPRTTDNPANIDKAGRAYYLKQFDDENGRLMDFLEKLDPKQIRKLSELSLYEVKTALDMAGEWAAKHAFEYSIRYVDFGEEGAAVLATPTTGAWRFYEYVYELLQ